MRKASKILVLILVVVMLFGIFSGCALIGKDLAKYRKATAIKVGNETISVGKLLDTFNSYYNTYYYYISAGYMTLDQLVDAAISSLYSQYIKVDKYVTTHTSDVYEHDFVGVYHNAEYLEDWEIAYVVKYVKYVVFQTFDNNVEENLSAKHDLKDPETEDTSREFSKPDDLRGATTYAEYTYKSNYYNEEMDEYFADYYPNLSADATLDYVYSDENNNVADAEKRLQEYNDRLEDDSEEITLEELTKAQKDVVELYSNSIKTAYGQGLEDFIAYEIEDMITSCIVNKYNYQVYKELEADDDIFDQLAAQYEDIRKAKQAEFAVGNNFKNFIESLNSSSYIYDVPDEKDYVFVKNILIPFSSAQSNLLTVLANQLGDSKRESYDYITRREAMAKNIVADDFNSEKDDDGKYGQIEGIFDLDAEGHVIINSEGELREIFGANGQVTAMEGMNEVETIKALMERFNTDVGQHSAMYDYVVYVGGDKDYKHPWVDTFWQATQNLMTESAEKGESGIGKYTLAVSDYGVHIIYVVGYVKAEILDFKTNYLKSELPEYRLFGEYWESCRNDLISEEYETLFEEYVKANKISATNTLKKFLKENGLDSFDFDKSLEIDD